MTLPAMSPSGLPTAGRETTAALAAMNSRLKTGAAVSGYSGEVRGTRNRKPYVFRIENLPTAAMMIGAFECSENFSWTVWTQRLACEESSRLTGVQTEWKLELPEA